MVEARRVDVVIFGSGFAGSVMAMICRRLGKSVVLLERSQHPRFAIGESSTPLTNLLLEQLAERYDLPVLRELANWGRWQRHHPGIGCGLKRGFTFFHHQPGQEFQRRADRANELLVAASPSDELADTHWFRADFDALLARHAVQLGADLWEGCQVRAVSEGDSELAVEVETADGVVRLRAGFAIDASGINGCLRHAFGLELRPLEAMPATETLFGHFSGVRTCDSDPAFQVDAVPPYPVDAAAVHHVFSEGWFWVLRFNNGTTSAGVMARAAWARERALAPNEASWQRVLSEFPSLKRLFGAASPVGAFHHRHQVAQRSERVRGERWALLPSAAASVDPLFSTGFPLTLLGIVRLGLVLESAGRPEEWDAPLEAYGRATLDEARRVGQLVGTAYQTMSCPALFHGVTLLYFAAVSFEEVQRRLGSLPLDHSFLLGDHPTFRRRLDTMLAEIRKASEDPSPSQGTVTRLLERIRDAIDPFNVIGLGAPQAGNWYPVRVSDLFDALPKLGTSSAALVRMLRRTGVTEAALKPYLAE